MTRHTSANSCNTTRTRSSSESDFYEIGRQFPLPQQDIHVTSCMQQNGLQSKFDRYSSLMNQIKVSAVQNQSSNYIDALRQRQMLLAQGLCASNSINGLENNLATAASNIDMREFPLPQQDIHVTSCMQQNGLQSKFDRYSSLMNQIKVSAVQNQSSNYIDALRQRQMLLAQGLCASNSINGLENNLATAASNVSTLEPTSQLQFIDMQTYDILNRRYPLFAYGNYHVSDVVMGQSSQVLSQFTQQNHDMQLDV